MDTYRRLRYSVAMSLDGYIADTHGGYDWIVMDAAIDFGAFMSTIDTLVMGRLTYELVKGQESGFGMEDADTYVVSTTLDPADHPDVTIVSDDVERFVSDLKAQSGKDIWLFGGGVLFRSLLAAGLVDRVEVAVMPVLLGGGVPLLPRAGPLLQGERVSAPVKLRRHSVEEMPKTGILLIKYDVEKKPA